ncbi:hypothetical protein [Halanaeroarchaeum sulfurireducens]|uniref:Uncharacterized protein n=1 Tax=Halanaeroarchaeum sulfurireducens TaxID=1604004 RepID=A0A0N9N0E2_9EURY|nr:hypothetical protein [Halanaeroarchaeum sulfurireducens]ALG81218.1 hypothetical protein HLASA_0308 [Halanaeroarchaeum sulfurireducens]
MNRQLRSVLLVAMLVVSVVGVGVTFTGVAAAANDGPTVEVNQVDDVVIDDSQSAHVVRSGDAIALNYTADSGSSNESITDATLTFEAVNGNTVVERSVTADKVTERVEDVQAPKTEGFYEMTLAVTDENGETAKHEVTADGRDGFLAVQTEDPTVNVESPSDGSQRGYPYIKGTAYDGAGIDNVTLTIKNVSSETERYWNDSAEAWQEAKTTFERENRTPSETFGEMVSWSYDLYQHKEHFDAGVYEITANAYDGQGNTLNDPTNEGPPSAADDEDTAPSSVDYELVISSAVVDSITFENTSTGNDLSSVHEANDDNVTINVSVSLRGTDAATLGEASVESSGLGIDASLENRTNGDETVYYEDTVDLGEPTVPEGDVPVTATVAMSSDIPAVTDTVSIELERAPADVQTLQVGDEFIGVVSDESESIPVTVDGVVDADGNSVSTETGSLSLEIADYTFESGVTATRGDVETDLAIEPADLDPATATGQRSVDVVYSETGATIASFDVRLVHEVYGLEADTYQPAGTPMPATDVLIDSDGIEEALAWDPSEEEWVGVQDPTAVGTGFVVTPGDDQNARIGYEFETDGAAIETRHEETLAAGTDDGAFHLLGSTMPLTEDDTTIDSKDEWEGDLVDSDTAFADGTAIDIWAPSSGETIATQQDPPVDWTQQDADALSGASLDEYGAYWIKLDADEDVDDLTRVFHTEAYNASAR